MGRLARRGGPLRFTIICFVASGLIRVAMTGPALAEQYATLDTAASSRAALANAAADGCQPGLPPDALMQAIAARTANLDARDVYINQREATLAVAETRIAEQLLALEAAETRLAATLARAETAAEEDVARLTLVYERMKPEAAAAIFETMDVHFAAGFLARMQPEAAAALLSSLPAELAYSVSVIIAGRNAAAPRN